MLGNISELKVPNRYEVLSLGNTQFKLERRTPDAEAVSFVFFILHTTAGPNVVHGR